MIATLQSMAGEIGALLAGISTGAAWVVAIVAPNVSYDRLDASRADGHVRQLIITASTPIAALLLAATALGILSGHIGAAVTAGLAAFGFFTNRWTLAPRKRGEVPPGVRQRKKSQRVVAVSLTLIFTLVAATSAVMAAFGV